MDLITPVFSATGWTAFVLSQLGVLYMMVASLAAVEALRRPRPSTAGSPAVTIIKPLKGSQDGLDEALERFCQQDYPGPIQIVFGVHDANDPAIGAVRRLQANHPDLDLELRIDPRIHGANLKASNLINIVDAVRHEILILSDADILVERDYVRTVVDTLAEPGVGLVTCYYVGRQRADLWSQLSAMAIDYQFMPGAILGKTLGLAQPCFGSTIAIRANILARIGGFARFANRLADDYEIGCAVRRLGMRIAMPPMVVAHVCDETDAKSFFGRELRWGRALRQISPAGYAGSVITYPLPLAMIAAILVGPSPLMLSLVAAMAIMRIAFKISTDAMTGASTGRWWLMPISDMLAFGLFLASFGINSVAWRGSRYRVSREGALIHP